MERLAIMDYSNSEIHIYNVDKNTNVDDEYIEDLGYDTGECLWMFGEDITVIEHKGILK